MNCTPQPWRSTAMSASVLSRADPEVRRAVEAMLAQGESSDKAILDRPAWEAAGQSIEVRPAELAAGAQLGPYRVESVIGAGGRGKVYRARDTRLDREVAIKASNAQFTQRFDREAKTVAALNHPNVCQIYDVGPNYVVMEFVDGAPIVSADRPSPLDPAEALRLAVQIASALEAAHEKGIIHRDLKPANILVSGGIVKLLDLGLAKQNTPSRPATIRKPSDSRNLGPSWGLRLIGLLNRPRASSRMSGPTFFLSVRCYTRCLRDAAPLLEEPRRR